MKNFALTERSYAMRSRGFTLVELVVTIAVLAIVLAIAAPSFQGMIERWRARQAAESLSSTLYYARSEAIRRGGNVTVGGLGGDWNSGWVVTDGGNVLQQYETPGNLTINAADIAFNRWGLVAGGFNSSITAGSITMNVCMSAAGRVQVISGGCP